MTKVVDLDDLIELVKEVREYNSEGLLIYEKNANGNESWYDYDDKGNRTYRKSLRDSEEWEEWIEYTDQRLEKHRKVSSGFEEWYDYDDNGDKIHYKNNQGVDYSFIPVKGSLNKLSYDQKINLSKYCNSKNGFRTYFLKSLGEGIKILERLEEYNEVKDKRELLTKEDENWLKYHKFDYYPIYCEDINEIQFRITKKCDINIFDEILQDLDIFGLELLIKLAPNQLKESKDSYIRCTTSFTWATSFIGNLDFITVGDYNSYDLSNGLGLTRFIMVKMLLDNDIVDGDLYRIVKGCENIEISEYVQKYIRGKLHYKGYFNLIQD